MYLGLSLSVEHNRELSRVTKSSLILCTLLEPGPNHVLKSDIQPLLENTSITYLHLPYYSTSSRSRRRLCILKCCCPQRPGDRPGRPTEKCPRSTLRKRLAATITDFNEQGCEAMNVSTIDINYYVVRSTPYYTICDIDTLSPLGCSTSSCSSCLCSGSSSSELKSDSSSSSS